MTRAWILILAASLSFGAASLLRPRLVAERDRLVGVEVGAAGEEKSNSAVTLLAGLGVLRPIVVNFLALRANALERQGRYFESVAIARAMTTLLPQLTFVWTFQASKLAYDISGEAPVEERLRWILESVRLLRDDARELNQTSPPIYLTLSLLFLQKIGGNADPTHRLYKDQFAELFESIAEDEVSAEWKLDRQSLNDLAKKYSSAEEAPSSALDLRSPFTHSLYWAERGLEKSNPDEDPAAHSQLTHYRAFSLRELQTRGLVLRRRQALGDESARVYASLPDLRFALAARATFDEQLQQYRDNVHVTQDLLEDLERYRQWLIVHQVIWGKFQEARDVFASTLIAADAGSLEDFLIATLLDVDPSQTAEVLPEARRALQVQLIRVAATLMISESAVDLDPAIFGFVSLARVLEPQMGDEEFSQLRLDVFRALSTAWRAADLGAFADRLEDRTKTDGASGGDARVVDVEGLGRLPNSLSDWGLEWLDPRFAREVEP